MNLPVTYDLPLAPREILRLQGYKRPSDIPTPQVLAILEEAVREARRLLAPRHLFDIFDVAEVSGEEIRLAGKETLRFAGARRWWGDFRQVGLGVLTLGGALEGRVDALLEAREFPLAFMLDAAGWVAIEEAALALTNTIGNVHIGRELKVTARHSPGYAGWDIWDQRVLFRLLPAERIGVRINDYCVMIPAKSLSFGVGIGPAAKVEQTQKCRRCDLRDCAFRLAPRRAALPIESETFLARQGTWDRLLGRP
ncbi:MAG: hypothetical protein HYY54_06700 [candidate division NC10 bacterium]|nr:hypothetical protein [candidate division NC10 bacterium]